MPIKSTKRVRLSVSSAVIGPLPLSARFLETIADEALKAVPEKVQRWTVDVRFVGDRRIRSLNRRWRGKDKVTDVLSFPQLETSDPSVVFPSPETSSREALLGDLILCVPQARRQARQKGHSVRKELAWMFVHGFLHLLGMDHQTDADELRMEAAERKALAVVLG